MPSGGATGGCALQGRDVVAYARGRSAEARHRGLVRFGVGALLALSIMPATGQPRAVISPVIERCREVLERCTLALQAAGAPLRWLPLALLGIGFIYAAMDRVRLTARVTHLLRAHRWRTPHPDEAIGRLAAEFRCGSSVRVVLGPAPNPAFTAGLLRPRSYLSEEFQRRLGPAELRAVVRHELYHVRRYDPLRFALLRFAQKMLFWLPFIGVLAEDLMEDAELMADDFAADASRGGDPLDVASALVKLGRANVETFAGVASLGGSRLLDRRVRRLASERVAPPPLFRWRPVVFSAAALVVIWLAAVLAPARVDAAMTMGWRDRCPHAMRDFHRHCPACEHQATEAMSDCGQ